MDKIEIGGFTLMEVGVILLLVAFGIWLVSKIPPVKKLVYGA